MALTIGPAGSRASKRALLTAHGIGLMLGASAMAMLLSLVAVLVAPALDAIREPMAIAAAIVVALWGLRTVTGTWGLPFPSSSWQVPVVWKEAFPPIFTAAAYGLLLGVGFLTSVVVPLYWVLLAGSVAVPSLSIVLLAWWLYAGVRLVTTISGSRARFDACQNLDELPETTPPGSQRSIRLASGMTLVGLGVYLLVVTIGG